MEASALNYAGGVGFGRSPLLRLQSDERLISLVRRGNPAAFETLVARYHSRLLAFCRHMLGSQEDAEDVLQEAFAAAYNAMLADDRPINARPWLYRIARNRSLNHLRRAQAVGVDSMDVHLSDFGATTADKVHHREDFRALIADIGELPETQRTALVLREMEALSYEQIAEAMETTIPGVKSLLVRARVSLAEAAEARELTCDEVRMELGQIAEGLLRKPTPPVRRHLKSCSRCDQFQGQLKNTNKALAGLMIPIGPLVVLRKIAITHLGHSAGSGATAAGSSAGAAGAGTAVGGTGAAAATGSGAAAAAGTGAAAGTTAVGAGTAGTTALASTGAAGSAVAAGSGASGLVSAGVGALATKAAAGLAAAALMTAGAVAVSHSNRARRAGAGAAGALVTPGTGGVSLGAEGGIPLSITPGRDARSKRSAVHAGTRALGRNRGVTVHAATDTKTTTAPLTPAKTASTVGASTSVSSTGRTATTPIDTVLPSSTAQTVGPPVVVGSDTTPVGTTTLQSVAVPGGTDTTPTGTTTTSTGTTPADTTTTPTATTTTPTDTTTTPTGTTTTPTDTTTTPTGTTTTPTGTTTTPTGTTTTPTGTTTAPTGTPAGTDAAPGDTTNAPVAGDPSPPPPAPASTGGSAPQGAAG
jgi:RNA polymerase sigma factor (sigma-70 family)